MVDIVINSGNERDTQIRIEELFRNIISLDKDEAPKEINLEKVGWVTPLSILPIAVKITKKIEDNPNLKIVYPPFTNVVGYLNHMHFPKGLDDYASYSQHTSYLPIIRLSLQGNSKIDSIDRAVSKYESLLDNIIGDQEYKQNIKEAVGYLLAEMVGNVLEHSNSKHLWIFAQYWKGEEEIEICLVDEGIGFRKAYQNAENPINPKDDVDAIKNALKGISSKKGFGDSERGYGIKTSLKLVTESELNGEFLIISGKACYSGMKKQLFKTTRLFWQGAIIMIRIKKPTHKVDIYKYIE